LRWSLLVLSLAGCSSLAELRASAVFASQRRPAVELGADASRSIDLVGEGGRQTIGTLALIDFAMAWSTRGLVIGAGIDWRVLAGQGVGYGLGVHALAGRGDAFVEISGVAVYVAEITSGGGCPGRVFADRVYVGPRLGLRAYFGKRKDGNPGAIDAGESVGVLLGFGNLVGGTSPCAPQRESYMRDTN
jgi:hypothetical protein